MCCLRHMVACRAARSAATYGRLSEALTPLPCMVVEPPEIRPFQLKKKNTAGGISKNESKGGFLVGRARVCPRRRQG